MTFEIWIFYVAATVLTCLTPGPATLLSMLNGIHYGKKSVAFSTLGSVVATSLLAVLSALGLGALVLTTGGLFQAIKVCGALYLMWMGFGLWRSNHGLNLSQERTGRVQPCAQKLFIKGFLVSISNPKALLFFGAFFPLFLNLQGDIVLQLLIMWTTFLPLSFGFIFGYGALASYTTSFLLSPNRMKWFNRISGLLFIVIGIALLFAHPASGI